MLMETLRSRPVLAALLAVALLVPAAAAAHPRGGSPSYVVRPGDTLSEIAVRHGSTVAAIAAANGITDPDRIYAGQRLTIPRGTSAGSGRYHVVRSGETLSGIAARYGIGVGELAARNGITDPDRVLAGARLRLDGGAVVVPATAAWRCPVAGPVRFSNDYGVAKGGGRFHEGIDLYAAAGTRVVASVAGRVERVEGPRGGRQVWLHGDDGVVYIGTHLARFGTAGRVVAGEVIGYVGTSGNAAGTSPHLHFEAHPSGAGPVNPYPLLVRACR